MCVTPRSKANLIICPNCGAKNSSLVKKCLKCKQELPSEEAVAFSGDDYSAKLPDAPAADSPKEAKK